MVWEIAESDPLQDRILIGKGVMSQLDAEQPRQIVGVVADVRDGALNQEPEPAMFIPHAQTPDAVHVLNAKLTPLAWVVRTRGEPMALRAAVEEQIRQASGLPVSDVRAMDEVVSRSTSRERFHMLLMSVFGAAALLLAVIGIYGLMAYSVEQRAQEIGIRMALGAGHSDVRGMVVRQGMVFAVAGLALGLGGAFALARQMSSLLFGVTAFDPVVFSAVPLALGAAALFAVWRPARRASRVDPVAALREG
jgi:predicted lysophospholipase L1 biosynthesis ABC-type transport system permease subunit